MLHVWQLVSMLHGVDSTLVNAHVRIHESVYAAAATAATARSFNAAATAAAACMHAVRDRCELIFMLEVVFVWEWFWWLMVVDADW